MTKKRLDEIFQQIAIKDNCTRQEVINSIQEMIDETIKDADPQTLAIWHSMPHRGDRPNPYELIDYILKLVKQKDYKTLEHLPHSFMS